MGYYDARRRPLRARFGVIAGSLALVAIAPLTAQTRMVAPSPYAAQEATGSTSLPFGRSGEKRVQMAYDSVLFRGPLVITGLGMRLDGGATASSKRVEFEVRLSTMPFGVTALQEDFATNRGRDESVVLARGSVVLPAHQQAQTPQPFSTRLPLQRNFSYDPARGSLLMEVVVYDQPPGSYRLDSTYTCRSGMAPVGPPGCVGTAGTPQIVIPTLQVGWGQPLVMELQNAPAGALTAVFLGSRDSGSWAGRPLPIDLGPIGAPSCWLSIDVLMTLTAFTSGGGSANHTLQLPSIPSLQYQWLPYQGAVADPGANPLGWTTTRAGKVEVCGWDAVARLSADAVSATNGTREIGIAPVLELTVP